MYSKEQRAKALCIYHRIGSVTDMVANLVILAENICTHGFVTREKQKKNKTNYSLPFFIEISAFCTFSLPMLS